MLKHGTYYYFLFALLLFFGCASEKQYLYEGHQLPPEEVANIRVFGKDWYSFKLDGKEYLNPPQMIILKGNNNTYEWRSRGWKSILPGEYEITVVNTGYSLGEIQSITLNNITIRNKKRLPGGISCSIKFEAKKGKTYIVEFENRINFPINSGKGVLLLEKYAYGTGNKTLLYEYNFDLEINEYIPGSKIEDGKLVGRCSDGT